MVDAEHSYFQPAIDHAAMELQRMYNQHKPTVLNTYQCYLQVCCLVGLALRPARGLGVGL